MTNKAESSSTETETEVDGTVFDIMRESAVDLTVTADDDGGEAMQTLGLALENEKPILSVGTVGLIAEGSLLTLPRAVFTDPRGRDRPPAGLRCGNRPAPGRAASFRASGAPGSSA